MSNGTASQPQASAVTTPAAAMVSVGALITDHDDKVLLVKPTYRDHWLFVRGAVDEGERPDAAL